MEFGQQLYGMSSAVDTGPVSNGFQFDNPSELSSPRPHQQQQHFFKTGENGSDTLSGRPHDPYGIHSPVTPTGDFPPSTGDRSMVNLITTTGSPDMSTFVATTDSPGFHNFNSTSTGSFWDPAMYSSFPQSDNPYGAVSPSWTYGGRHPSGSNAQATAGMDAALTSELARLDTQLARGMSTFETHYGQPTPPEDRMEVGIPPADLEGSKRRKSTGKARKSSAALIEAIEDLDDPSLSKKLRRQRKVEARKDSGAAVAAESEDDEKREKFLERNRVAASKCREKKKKWTENLELKERSLRMENKFLHAMKADLNNQLLSLKNKALQHSECECDNIREYLLLSLKGRMEEQRRAQETVGGQLDRRTSDISESSEQMGVQSPSEQPSPLGHHSRKNSSASEPRTESRPG